MDPLAGQPHPDTLKLEPGSHVHVMGAAGVGMSALAQLLLASGFHVTGSDRFHDQGETLPILERLQKAGLVLVAQDGSTLTPGTTLVASTAIESDNPELVAARKHACTILHRAILLAALARDEQVIAVAGTAGKTTVTGMLGYILEQAGLDPTVVSGGAVLNWTRDDWVGSVRAGGGGPWVLEVDESDRSLLLFHPQHAVLTNMSTDHYSYEEVVSIFSSFSRQVEGDLVCGDGVPDALASSGNGFHAGVPCWEKADESEQTFTFEGATFRIPMPGLHNMTNALLAAALAQRLGVEPKTSARALKGFKGIERRLEHVGRVGEMDVYDDYAHNPAKISAAITTLAKKYSRVHVVWRPHGFAPLSIMFDELVDVLSESFRPRDTLYLLPVFYVGGSVQQTRSSEDLGKALEKRSTRVHVVNDYETIARKLMKAVRPGEAVLCMGARDPQLPRFAREMVERLEQKG